MLTTSTIFFGMKWELVRRSTNWRLLRSFHSTASIFMPSAQWTPPLARKRFRHSDGARIGEAGYLRRGSSCARAKRNIDFHRRVDFAEFADEVRDGWSDVLNASHYRTAHATESFTTYSMFFAPTRITGWAGRNGRIASLHPGRWNDGVAFAAFRRSSAALGGLFFRVHAFRRLARRCVRAARCGARPEQVLL